jgi:hypothetical protein
MDILGEFDELERRIRTRVAELQPAVAEHEELRALAERLGIDLGEEEEEEEEAPQPVADPVPATNVERDLGTRRYTVAARARGRANPRKEAGDASR